jgi:transcription factor S
MLFCPKCGSLLKIKREKNKKFQACSCGYASKELGDVQLKEEYAKSEKKFDVVSEDDQTLPLTEAECPKCGHGKAYFWLIQTRAGDEGDTKFFRCEKCKNVWRDYS